MRASCRASTFVLCMLFCANCGRKTQVSQDSRADVDAGLTNADTTFDAAGPSTASAWTDPPLVDKLRDDCGFDPRKLNDAQKEELFGNRYGATELTCLGNGFDQSCVYDPCFETAGRTCTEGCLKDCGTCDDKCVSSCFACKANCGDDECRNACAPTCAECKQSCITSQDRCRSGKCGQAYMDCRRKLSSDWKSQNCTAICAQFTPCKNVCYDKMLADKSGDFDNNACLNRCKAPLKTSCDLGLCAGKYGMGIQMERP
jgi:hypothetical protein